MGGLINSTITNCYSTGSVKGYMAVGGLLGVKGPFLIRPDFSGITGDTISDFYSTANITGNSDVGQPVIRGFIHEVVNSFWDVETSGRATSAGGTGKTTVEMQTASTFLAAGWDFVDETENGTEDIWRILEGQDYPRLWWQPEEAVVEQVSLPLRWESSEMILGLGRLWSAVYSPDGKYIATAGSLGAFLWNAETGALLRTFLGHTDGVNSVAFSPDGTRVLTGSVDSTAKLWDAETGREIRTFLGHTSLVWSVAFSPDGTRVLTGSRDNTVKLWDAETGQEIRTFRGYMSIVTSVAFSPDGTRVLTGSGSAAKLWDAETGQEIRTFGGHTGWVYSVAFSPDGTRVLTGSLDSTARLWDAETGQEIRTLYVAGPFRGVFAGRDAGPDGECGWDGADLAAGTASTAGIARTFLEAGWDFVNEVDNGSEDI